MTSPSAIARSVTIEIAALPVVSQYSCDSPGGAHTRHVPLETIQFVALAPTESLSNVSVNATKFAGTTLASASFETKFLDWGSSLTEAGEMGEDCN